MNTFDKRGYLIQISWQTTLVPQDRSNGSCNPSHPFLLHNQLWWKEKEKRKSKI